MFQRAQYNKDITVVIPCIFYISMVCPMHNNVIFMRNSLLTKYLRENINTTTMNTII